MKTLHNGLYAMVLTRFVQENEKAKFEALKVKLNATREDHERTLTVQDAQLANLEAMSSAYAASAPVGDLVLGNDDSMKEVGLQAVHIVIWVIQHSFPTAFV